MLIAMRRPVGALSALHNWLVVKQDLESRPRLMLPFYTAALFDPDKTLWGPVKWCKSVTLAV